MSRLDDLLARRMRDTRRYDPEVWDFMDRVDQEKGGGVRLRDMSEVSLQQRLRDIELNILYLDDGIRLFDDRDHNDGWTSPWWWYRARHWTLSEFGRRGIARDLAPDLPPMPPIPQPFHGVYAGGGELLVRMSKTLWLREMLSRGTLRFSPAATYLNSGLNAAQADDEMAKTYQRPGGALTITTASGAPIRPIGEVRFATERRTPLGNVLVDRPYWMLSFSSDLDPRLFDAFSGGDPSEYAALVIFNVPVFMARAAPIVISAAPGTRFATVRNSYYDPYNPPAQRLETIRSKLMAYAYQLEVRLIVDPEGFPPPASGIFEVEVGSLEDIAGLYGPAGQKLGGTGPVSFFPAAHPAV